MVEVERILLTEWDPVGVKGEPMAECEYCRYAGRVAQMLWKGNSEDDVADYLSRVESERMGLGPDADRCSRAAHECRALLA
jgi:hypothetical protein